MRGAVSLAMRIVGGTGIPGLLSLAALPTVGMVISPLLPLRRLGLLFRDDDFLEVETELEALLLAAARRDEARRRPSCCGCATAVVVGGFCWWRRAGCWAESPLTT